MRSAQLRRRAAQPRGALAARPLDVALGFDSVEAYREQAGFCGALVGRCANRIGGARFTLGGREYRLPQNDGGNHLHGGPAAFDKRLWTIEEAAEDRLTLSLVSEDGDAGYPGRLDVRVSYTLADGALEIDYFAVSDADTVCNLTSHAYFNLSGHASGPVNAQRVCVFADAYTPADAALIPTGELASVEGTPMDLRGGVVIGEGADLPFEALRLAGGYDHNWAVNGQPGVLRPAARAESDETGVAHGGPDDAAPACSSTRATAWTVSHAARGRRALCPPLGLLPGDPGLPQRRKPDEFPVSCPEKGRGVQT